MIYILRPNRDKLRQVTTRSGNWTRDLGSLDQRSSSASTRALIGCQFKTGQSGWIITWIAIPAIVGQIMVKFTGHCCKWSITLPLLQVRPFFSTCSIWACFTACITKVQHAIFIPFYSLHQTQCNKSFKVPTFRIVVSQITHIAIKAHIVHLLSKPCFQSLCFSRSSCCQSVSRHILTTQGLLGSMGNELVGFIRS